MVSSISRIAAACLLAAACSTPAASRGSLQARPYGVFAPHGTLGLVELAQLSPELDAYRALEHLRPDFLRLRPGTSLMRGERPTLHVYINGNYAGDVSALRTLYVRNITGIRRLQRTEMHLAPGGSLGPAEGAILVTTR